MMKMVIQLSKVEIRDLEASQHKSDFIIIGGGPAGALLSILLNRNDHRVTLLNFKQNKSHLKPFEVLGPQAVLKLRNMGIPTLNLGQDCDGIVSNWENEEPFFYDYKLITAVKGKTVEKGELSKVLLEVAKNEGVFILDSIKAIKHIANNSMVYLPDTKEKLSSNWVIQATGRTTPAFKEMDVQRVYFDKLVGISIPGRVDDIYQAKRLLVEPASQGWWYRSPTLGGKCHLVFMTDYDLIPKNGASKSEWIMDELKKTRLVQKNFSYENLELIQTHGSDARFSSLTHVTHKNWISLGDAALSLDPLSGNGVEMAISSAEYIASAFKYSSKNFNAEEYNNWHKNKLRDEVYTRRMHYSRADHLLHNNKFWKRRIAQ